MEVCATCGLPEQDLSHITRLHPPSFLPDGRHHYVVRDDGLDGSGWPDRMEMLGQLMEAVGAPNDGSPPKVLWERCIAEVGEVFDRERGG